MAKPKKPSAPRKVVEDETPEIAMERAEDARVLAMAGGVVNRDARTGRTNSREVFDVVKVMTRTKDENDRPLIGAEEAGAVRKLERLIEKAYGNGGSCLSTLERVNGQSSGDPTLASVIRHTEAANDLKQRQDRLGPRTWAMLRELCDGKLSMAHWHNVVERHTGEGHPKAQGALIRQAFRELASVEREIHARKPANDTSAQDVRLPLVG
jgi:hypothetical protein